MRRSRNKSHVQVISLKNQSRIADQCTVAESFLTRLKGLIGTRKWEKGQGLLLDPCRDIHMWFMSIPIDVVFLRRESDTEFQVTSVRADIRPWKLLPVHDFRATQTLELPVGTIDRCDIRPGDRLCLSSQ